MPAFCCDFPCRGWEWWKSVQDCARLCKSVQNCRESASVQNCARVCNIVQKLCTNVQECAQMRNNVMCKTVQECAKVCKSMQYSAEKWNCARSCTLLHTLAHSCTLLHNFAWPLCDRHDTEELGWARQGWVLGLPLGRRGRSYCRAWAGIGLWQGLQMFS